MTNIVETFDPACGTTWSVHTAGMSKEQAFKAAEALVRRSFENINAANEVRMKDDFGPTKSSGGSESGWRRRPRVLLLRWLRRRPRLSIARLGNDNAP